MSDLFKTHQLNEDGVRKAQGVGEAFDSLLTFVAANCPEGRELALAKTHMENACYWVKKAIARLPANQAEVVPVETKAKKAFAAYNAEGPNPNKTWDGKDVPPWEGLNDQVRGKWLAAAKALVVLVLFLPALALAQAVVAPVPAPSIGSTLLGFLTPANIGGAVVALLGLVGGFTFLTDRRKKALATAAYYAFHIVEDVVDQLDDGPAKDGFKKTDAALAKIDAYLVASGWRPMKPGEQAAAALQLSAIAGQGVVAEKLVVAQAQAQAASLPPR